MAELLGYTAGQVRQAEEPHLAAGEPLMARAAAAVAEEIRAVLAQRRPGAHRVLLLVGAGNNGGDALYAGEELAREGMDVAVFLALDRVHEAGLAAAIGAGARRIPRDALAATAADADVIVDGLVGTGSSGALRGALRDAVTAVLPALGSADPPAVVAVDIPSGIDPDTGAIPQPDTESDAGPDSDTGPNPDSGPAVLPADVTVTFGGIKAGLLLPPASGLAGRVALVDIGLGPELDRMEPAVRLPGAR